jgi:hypothetical protein
VCCLAFPLAQSWSETCLSPCRVRQNNHTHELIAASVRKTTDLRARWTGTTPDRVCSGYIMRRPAIGRRLVVFCGQPGSGLHRHESMTTSPVLRIIPGLFDNEMWIETADSVYSVALGSRVLGPTRVRVPRPEPAIRLLRAQPSCRRPAPLPDSVPAAPVLGLAA